VKRLLVAVACLCSFVFAQSKPQVTVAAAANLSDVFRSLGPKFESATGIHPVFSFASTAQLTQQIENGAPFDVFTAADSSHVEQLVRSGKLTKLQKSVYARGLLALWLPNAGQASVQNLKDLTSASVKTIAIAKPELAPYGEAAVEALKRAGIWVQVNAKVVYAENINMAKQYGTSGNADAVLTAYSLVLHEQGKVIRVDPKLYHPIDQALGVVTDSANKGTAEKFVNYLLRGDGRALLREFGYEIPGR
jgi:molybdate transport system substrate-binding protein